MKRRFGREQRRARQIDFEEPEREKGRDKYPDFSLTGKRGQGAAPVCATGRRGEGRGGSRK